MFFIYSSMQTRGELKLSAFYTCQSDGIHWFNTFGRRGWLVTTLYNCSRQISELGLGLG